MTALLEAGAWFLGLWFLAGVLFAAVWWLTAPLRNSWDKEIDKSDRPLDLTGWRR